MFGDCDHIWQVVSKEIFNSPMEQMAEAGFTELTGESGSIDIFEKPCIVHYKCMVCGTEKVKRI